MKIYDLSTQKGRNQYAESNEERKNRLAATKQIEDKVYKLYQNKGQSAAYDWVNKYMEKNKENSLIAYEHCNGCDCSTPSIEHSCLLCGQETDSLFWIIEDSCGNHCFTEHKFDCIEDADAFLLERFPVIHNEDGTQDDRDDELEEYYIVKLND